MAVRIEFDWDPVKAASNLNKHKVSFEDAMTVLGDPLALSCLDHVNSGEEDRWITVGVTRDGKLLLVIHTYSDLAPGHVYIRIISARPPTKREKRDYEQATD